MTQPASTSPAYEPRLHPELYEGVRLRRILAFIVDLVVITLLSGIGFIIVAIAGLFTFGAGLLLYSLVVPVTIFGYSALTLGLRSSTIGMGLLGLEMRILQGPRMTIPLAIGHTILYYVVGVTLTPLALLVSLFNRKKRLFHDMLLGVVVINDPVKASFYVRR